MSGWSELQISDNIKKLRLDSGSDYTQIGIDGLNLATPINLHSGIFKLKEGKLGRG